MWPVAQRPPSQQLAQRVAKTTTRVPGRTFSNPIRHTRTPSHRFEAPHLAPAPPLRSAAANESRVPDAGSASPWAHAHTRTRTCAAQRLFPYGQGVRPSITSTPGCYNLLQLLSPLSSASTSRDVTTTPSASRHASLSSAAPRKSISPQCPNHPVHQPQGLRFALPSGSGLHFSPSFPYSLVK